MIKHYDPVSPETHKEIKMGQDPLMGGDFWTGTRRKVNADIAELYTDVAARSTLPAVATYAASQVLTAAQCYNTTVFVTAVATITLPAVAVGMSLDITQVGAFVMTIDPDTTQIIILNGTALAGGVTIVSDAATGETVKLVYHSAGTWYATSATLDAGA